MRKFSFKSEAKIEHVLYGDNETAVFQLGIYDDDDGAAADDDDTTSNRP